MTARPASGFPWLTHRTMAAVMVEETVRAVTQAGFDIDAQGGKLQLRKLGRGRMSPELLAEFNDRAPLILAAMRKRVA